MNHRNIFFQHLAATSQNPLAIEIVKAKGIYLYDKNGREYIDAISGINVSYMGHCNPAVIKKIHTQLKKYAHLMVYGEIIQGPASQYAALLCEHLPQHLNNIYFTNSGSEAVEAAMKLAKRYTKQNKIIAFNASYHGSTQGALSLIGDEYWRNAFRPLLPNVFHYDYNDDAVLNAIDEDTACVILEPIQAEAGIIIPEKKWIQALAKICKEKNVLLIFDEIQTAFWRTGKLWAFEELEIIPDILLLGKALGGGLPLGALISNKELMQSLSYAPVLGHISTFGGNAITCQAGLASFELALEKNIAQHLEHTIPFFEKLLLQLSSDKIISIQHKGLWAAIRLQSREQCLEICNACIQEGLFTDWLLFASDCLRIAPPLSIKKSQIKKMFSVLQKCLFV